jgi:hypothetical protein
MESLVLGLRSRREGGHICALEDPRVLGFGRNATRVRVLGVQRLGTLAAVTREGSLAPQLVQHS